MPSSNAKNIRLPWHQHDEYWITLYPKTGSFTMPVKSCLELAGLQRSGEEGMSVRTKKDWKKIWDGIYTGLKYIGALADVEVVFISDAAEPVKRSESECKSPEYIQQAAESLWLGDALLENRLICYLQSVMGPNDKIFGYESFARVRETDGRIIGGDKIFAASKVLGIEYMIDRVLHIEAIKTFVNSDFNGFLFVNFFPGFIHRPSIYLEGLTETAKSYGVLAKHIVLDFTNSELPHDIQHINNVSDYARSRGYSIALDDVSSLDNAKKLIPEIRPDFVKIDMHLVREVLKDSKRDIIRGIVELAHQAGSTVIAEGVETDDILQALKLLKVDLFQGYFFSPPLPVEAALARGTSAS